MHRRGFLSVLSFVMVVAAVATITISPAPSALGVTPTVSVSGRVYNDLWVDGTYHEGFDPGVAGVTVDAYGNDGVKVGTATSAADGTYSIDLDPVPTGSVRVEFLTPTGFQTVVARSGAARSSIEFVEPGATNVDYGIFDPTKYCEYSIASVCMGQGSRDLPDPDDPRQNGTVHLSPFSPPTVQSVGFPIADKQDGTYSTELASKAETGALWGLGYQPKWGLLWNSAVIRRHVGLGPQGIGGLYAYDLDGNQIASFDLTSKGLVLTDATSWADADRDIRTNTNAYSPYPTRRRAFLSRDVQAFSRVGKVGIGDIDVSIDDNYLWVSNLYERKIHRLEIAGSAGTPTLGAVASWSIDDGHTCAAGTGPFRAWAMDPRPDGTVVVAGQCTNEDALPANDELPGAGVILLLDPASSGAAAWTTLTTFSFDYQHIYDNCDNETSLTCTWKAWSDDWTGIKAVAGFTRSQFIWTQPMIVNVEQLPDGSFVLGINDRLSYQLGSDNYEPTTAQDPALVTSWTQGDTLLVCKTASGWTRETGGGCAGDRTYPVPPTTGDQGREGEFFSDTFQYSHLETTIGGLAYANGQVAVSSMDPAAFYSGGIRWMSIVNGDQTNALNISPDTTQGFGKSAGMGDLEAICDGSPLQIGNRIWSDDDKDGIQDPDESPIAGVTVRLYDSGSVLVGTAVTDDRGEYYFTSSTLEPANGGTTPDAFGGGLTADASFTIKVDDLDDCGVDGVLFGWKLTTQDATSAGSPDSNLIDSDAAGVGSSWCDEQGVPTVTVPPRSTGIVDHSFDIGFNLDKVAVGDYTWIDADEDGVQDAGELPLANVTVTLYDSTGTTAVDNAAGDPATDTTDNTGYYFIDNLLPGDYTAEFTLPTGFVFTEQMKAGTPSTDDSNPDVTTGFTDPFTLVAAVSGDMVADVDNTTVASFVDPTIDAGVTPPPLVGMGDYTWIDADQDGIQGEEPPLEGVVVTLYTSSNGTPSETPATTAAGDPATDTTDDTGYYFIDGLYPGDYVAEFTLPSGYTFTQDFAATDETADSNPDPATGVTPEFTIDASETGDTVADTDPNTLAEYVNPTIDAGVVPLVAMGDYTWIDANENGVQDDGEPPLANVTVTLYDSTGTTAVDNAAGDPATDVTDNTGYYFIDNLLPGEYTAEFTLPTGLEFTEQMTVGTPSTDDSNPDVTTGFTDPFTLVAEVSGDMVADTDDATVALFVDPTIDAGVLPPPLVAMGDYTWIDSIENGVQDDGEEPLAGVTVTLYASSNGTPSETPADNAAGDPATATTDETGHYFIDGLYPGDYVAEFTLPTGYSFTQDLAGLEESVDSNPDPATGVTPEFAIAAAAAGDTVADTDELTLAEFVNPTIDAGVVEIPLVAVGDYTWIDADEDGVQDQGEEPLEGVTVTLYEVTNGTPSDTPAENAAGDPATDTTDVNGFYFIDALFPGEYVAEFTLPSGYVFTEQTAVDGTSATDSNPDPATGVTPTFSVTDSVAGDTVADIDDATIASFVNPTIDAGVIDAPLVGMGDVTWIDSDRDGQQDLSEVPLPGVVVTLYEADGTTPAADANGDAATATTNERGFYFIDALEPGDYRAQFDLPPGYGFTDDLVPPRVTDSNPDPATGMTPTFTIDAAVAGDTVVDDEPLTVATFHNPTIDAGVVPLVAMGDYTWIDTDRDGLQDGNEDPLAGVTVTLVEADGTTPVRDVDGDLARDVTDADGYYFIDALLPGDYRVQFTLPDGYVFTIDDGGAVSIDSNPDPDTGLTPTFTIEPIVSGNTVADVDAATRAVLVDPTIDAGVVPLVAMGDYTWVDADRDGVQDRNEIPLAGVTVTLVQTDGRTPVRDVDGELATDVTDGDGYYFIDALLPGDYRAQFTLPDGLVFTIDEGGAVSRDSNPDPDTGLTPTFTIEPVLFGNTVTDVDEATRAVLVDPTIDAGVVVVDLVAVGDYVWVDTDRDGLQDPDEAPLAGVTVTLFLEDGTTPARDVDGNLASTITADDGSYFIDALVPGSYVAQFAAPSGYLFTRALTGDPRLDSNPTATGSSILGRSAAFTLVAAEEGQMVPDTDAVTRAVFVDPTIDAGVVRPAVPSRPGGWLPTTGGPWVTFVWFAALLLAAGAALVVIGRRRRTA